MQNNDIDIAIAIVGRISSGKSTFAKELSSSYNINIASFGSYLKHYCETNSFKTDRKTLQQIGDKFIHERPETLLSNVIKHFIQDSNSLIFEGVRHRIIFDELKKSSRRYISIFIDADQITRYKRYNDRKKDADIDKSWKEFLVIDNHPVELEIETLKGDCDIIVDSTNFSFHDFKNIFDDILSSKSIG